MDEVEQRFVAKYFFIKGWGNKKLTAEVQMTFHHSAFSSSTVKRWMRKFKNGDLFCDHSINSTSSNVGSSPAEVP
jgi:transposase